MFWNKWLTKPNKPASSGHLTFIIVAYTWHVSHKGFAHEQITCDSFEEAEYQAMKLAQDLKAKSGMCSSHYQVIDITSSVNCTPTNSEISNGI